MMIPLHCSLVVFFQKDERGGGGGFWFVTPTKGDRKKYTPPKINDDSF